MVVTSYEWGPYSIAFVSELGLSEDGTSNERSYFICANISLDYISRTFRMVTSPVGTAHTKSQISSLTSIKAAFQVALE